MPRPSCTASSEPGFNAFVVSEISADVTTYQDMSGLENPSPASESPETCEEGQQTDVLHELGRVEARLSGMLKDLRARQQEMLSLVRDELRASSRQPAEGEPPQQATDDHAPHRQCQTCWLSPASERSEPSRGKLQTKLETADLPVADGMANGCFAGDAGAFPMTFEPALCLDRARTRMDVAKLRRKPTLLRSGVQLLSGSKQSVRSPVRSFCGSHPNKVSLMTNAAMSIVVLGNAITLGLSTDVETPFWRFLEFGYLCIFTSDVLFRGWLLGPLEFITGSEWRWNIFDVYLTIQAVVDLFLTADDGGDEGSALEIIRLVRVLRATRCLRLFKLAFFADMLMMVKGIIGGMRTLLWSVVLVAFPLYVFAITLREAVGNEARRYPGSLIHTEASEPFRNLPTAFFTMFRCVVATDCSSQTGKPIFVLLASVYGWGYAALYMSMMMFMTFGLFNVIVAIYVENTVAAAKFDEIHTRRDRLSDRRWFQDRARDLVCLIWSLHQTRSGLPDMEIPFDEIVDRKDEVEISRSLFQELEEDKGFKEILANLDVREENQVDLFDTLDADARGHLTLDDVVGGLALLRGDTRNDRVAFVQSVRACMRTHEDNIIQRLHQHSARLSRRSTKVISEQGEASAAVVSAAPQAVRLGEVSV